MAKAFEKFTDDELYKFLAVNCPEGQLLEACDELVERFEFYKTVLTELANQGGRTLEEFISYVWPDDEKFTLEDMSLTALNELYSELKAEQDREVQRQDLIKKIKELQGK